MGFVSIISFDEIVEYFRFMYYVYGYIKLLGG